MSEVKVNKVGHYQLGKTLGNGGFAKVKEARHDITNSHVAVKIMNKKKMKNKNLLSKVKREIKILKQLNHPNIIKFYEAWETTNDIFVVMELAEKGELTDNLPETRLAEQQARYYFRQILDGLEYVHSIRISHRDLKLQNILIDSNDVIKIGDFGLSNLMKDGRLLKTACGSLNYAAPEIIAERKYEGTSVDVWSCGVILYVMLTGNFPFHDDNITLLYKKIQPYEMPMFLTPCTKDLISRMLQVDPRRRLTIQEIKAHPWIKQYVPVYMKLTYQFAGTREDECEIDEGVLAQVKNLKVNFNGYTDEKIEKIILKKDNFSFAVAYQLLKSEKQRRIYKQNQQIMREVDHGIFKKIENELPETSPPPLQNPSGRFLYGKYYDKNPKILLDKLSQVLRSFQIENEVRSQQYCIKCLKSSQKKAGSSRQMKDQNQQPERALKKEDKFCRTTMRFTIQVYEVNRKTQTHLVDICLNQGHPLIFFKLVGSIYEQMEECYYKY